MIVLNPSVVVARHVLQTRRLTAQVALDLISARREIYLSSGIEAS